MQTQIIYEDNNIIVVYKQAGLATQSARVTQADVVSELTKYLAAKTQKAPYLGLIHRLDQPVEGLLVFAKDKKTAANLSTQLGGDSKTCQKIYYAVVHLESTETNAGAKNNSESEPVQLTDYLIKDAKTNLAKVVSKDTPQAKKAVLEYQILEIKEDIALVKIMLKTGRFHQIRVQLSNAKMPLLGDLKYGTEASRKASLDRDVKTVALCAGKLSFIHPQTHKIAAFSARPHNPIFGIFEEAF